MLYRVIYEKMEADVGLIFEKIAFIDIDVSGDTKRRLTNEIEKLVGRVVVSDYRVESEGDEVGWDYGFY